jgi:DNA-binding CsgD family transcriptional regulator
LGASPARKLLDAVAAIGEERDFFGFCNRTIIELQRLIPSEQVFCCVAEAIRTPPFERVSLVDVGIPAKARRAYLDRYYFMDPARKAASSSTPFFSENWRRRIMSREEFALDFMRALMHIDMSAGIPLLDPAGMGGICFGFTRTNTGQPTHRDEEIMLAFRPHLVNFYAIHKRFESLPKENVYAAELAGDNRLLSKREAEIAGLLCKRLRPAEIATFLLISPRTVERHIEHIYFKMNVKSRQELLTKLLAGRQ